MLGWYDPPERNTVHPECPVATAVGPHSVSPAEGLVQYIAGAEIFFKTSAEILSK